ncbi:MAG TPA: histidine kinase dimerization/phospho-acceptor domain-containing protein, partial [Pseudomonadales bacterium]|nr:histidine kinase dimerization/phospho-acceptor domain-containing protein [Pseudomonadales bacterium]
MNLRSRITLFALIPGILCSLLIGAYLSYALVRDIAEYENQMGNAYSEQIALQSFSFLQSANIPALQNTAQLALEYPLLRSITYYDARHQEIAHAGPRHKILTDDQASSTVFDTRTVKKETSENRQLYVPITQKRLTPTLINEATDSDPAAISPTIGWVRLEFSRSFMMLHKYRTMLIDTLVVGIVIAASFWIVMPFSDRLTRTVQQITRGARSISEDNGAIPLPTSNITELQELSDAISDMNNAIAEQQSGLQHHIEQSTQDLRETLETIEIQNIELDLARREAVQANRIKSEFLANTSHEIRTPLNSIIGFSKLLLKTPMSQQQQDFLQNIRKSSENLLTIINDVLDLSKIEAGKLVLDYIAFDLNETIEEILQILAHGAHEKGLELLHIIYSDVPRHLLGDPQRLKQILTNLISNAIKFSDNGNVVVRVSAENTEKNEVLLKIEVTDSGKGLPNGNQLIFNAFTQLDDPEKAQRLADRFAKLNWPRILDRWANQVNPLLRELLS